MYTCTVHVCVYALCIHVHVCVYVQCTLYMYLHSHVCHFVMSFVFVYNHDLSMQDLFFKFPWNNFLHSQVEGCVSAAVSTTVPVAVAPSDGNSAESSESTDDRFSLKYHVSSLSTLYDIQNVHVHVHNFLCIIHVHTCTASFFSFLYLFFL